MELHTAGGLSQLGGKFVNYLEEQIFPILYTNIKLKTRKSVNVVISMQFVDGKFL